MDSVLPDGIQHAQAAVLDDKVYIGGGITMNPENETKIFVFNHKTEAKMKHSKHQRLHDGQHLLLFVEN